MKIKVNGEMRDFEGTSITYEQIVELAGKKGHPSVTYSVRVSDDIRRSGPMHAGTSVTVVESMTFSAIHTGNA
jgi:hypothetical protein